MLRGANAIQYNLYKLGDATVWTTTSTQPGTGSGAAQNVPAGIYSDTVRVILTYWVRPAAGKPSNPRRPRLPAAGSSPSGAPGWRDRA
ncbi:hypothetical protein BANRA_04849 [Pseudomonas aeruginosa]|nr:hypothetical protein BANRA_04849 [Pseudomonas aeruginosa]